MQVSKSKYSCVFIPFKIIFSSMRVFEIVFSNDLRGLQVLNISSRSEIYFKLFQLLRDLELFIISSSNSLIDFYCRLIFRLCNYVTGNLELTKHNQPAYSILACFNQV